MLSIDTNLIFEIQTFRRNSAWRLIDYPGTGSAVTELLWYGFARVWDPLA